MNKSESIELLEDTGTSLNLWIKKSGTSLVMADESGYISILITEHDWNVIRNKVDEYFKDK